MLAEVAVRRAEEIKHLTEANGFLFQQIKMHSVKGRRQERKTHERNMPGKKKTTCLLAEGGEIIRGHCISVKRQWKCWQG